MVKVNSFVCLLNCFVLFIEFQEAFQLFDNRGDGKIHVSQIGDALRALGQNPTESDVKKYTHQHKPDERVSFEVFLPIYQVGVTYHYQVCHCFVSKTNIQ